MTLPVSGAISLYAVAVELNIPAAGINLNQANVKALAGGVTNMNALHGKVAASTLSAVGIGDSSTVSSIAFGGTVSCYPQVTPTGGVAPYTYSWAFTATYGNATISNATSRMCGVNKIFGKGSNGSIPAVLRCIVNDSVGASVTVTNISADLFWGTQY